MKGLDLSGFQGPLSAKDKLEIARATWRYKVIEATRGNQTKMGTLVLAILQKATDHPPRIMYPQGYISEDGMLIVGFQSGDGRVNSACPYCTVQELVDNMRKLCDHCQLSDDETTEFFLEARKFIAKDLRPGREEAPLIE